MESGQGTQSTKGRAAWKVLSGRLLREGLPFYRETFGIVAPMIQNVTMDLFINELQLPRLEALYHKAKKAPPPPTS